MFQQPWQIAVPIFPNRLRPVFAVFVRLPLAGFSSIMQECR
jgi:hypothetical protein